jgi:PhnB protein
MSPSMMIDTFEFEGIPEKGHVSLETARLEGLPGGRTRLTIQSVFQSVADRDGMIGSGMEQGVRESHERLDELLERLKMQSTTTRLVPYLRFNGNCREAMNFYRECLGGELKVMTVGESAMASQMPPKMRDMIMHAVLETNGIFIMASDNMGQEKIGKGNMISLTLTGNKKENIEAYFAKLSRGGKISHAIEKVFFGWYGDFTDRFGIDWMVQAESSGRS